ncbi:MAG: FAD-dependent oxidoreductase [Lachnospiraceae bacterium]|nr:FAD-dependent oxidoreductase [Lachnospiraceae bacterium]
MVKKDIVIIGGGPAGLAAAKAARENGADDILIIERDSRLGGILNQCIHNGFGLQTFREELTGPEYADRYIKGIEQLKIPYMLNTIVTDIKDTSRRTDFDEEKDPADQCAENAGICELFKDTTDSGRETEPTDNHINTKTVTVMNREDGLLEIEAKAVILAMGCRERARGSMNTPGFRGAGIFSAGTAQLYVNAEGRMPGKRVVIVGSGDIGLIMARRMTLEGAKVLAVVEIMPYSGGLKRNIIQCLNDYDIPLMLSHTVVDIHGKERVTAVTIARVDENLKPVEGSEEIIECDTVLYSVGLIPENELTKKLSVRMDDKTNGPVVNNALETDAEGVFACGNVLHVHDIVDRVSKEAENAGKNAAAYVKNMLDTDTAKGYIESGKKNVYRPGENDDKLTCIKCPNGCELTVTKNADGSLNVTGNLCPKGLAYAIEEHTHPMRTLTSTVVVDGGEYDAVSVKTETEIPKEKIMDCVEALRDVTVSAPVKVGDVILENVADTGVSIVATGNVGKDEI